MHTDDTSNEGIVIRFDCTVFLLVLLGRVGHEVRSNLPLCFIMTRALRRNSEGGDMIADAVLVVASPSRSRGVTFGRCLSQ